MTPEPLDPVHVLGAVLGALAVVILVVVVVAAAVTRANALRRWGGDL